MTRRVIQLDASWLALLLAALVLTGIVGLCIWLWPIRATTIEPIGIDPSQVRAVCAQYAGLDLSGLAPLCRQAGFQQ